MGFMFGYRDVSNIIYIAHTQHTYMYEDVKVQQTKQFCSDFKIKHIQQHRCWANSKGMSNSWLTHGHHWEFVMQPMNHIAMVNITSWPVVIVHYELLDVTEFVVKFLMTSFLFCVFVVLLQPCVTLAYFLP